MIKRNIKIIFAYDGSGYYGYQRQKSLLTIQGEMEAVLSQILGEKIVIHSAGRTDAGVHALGQVISFKTINPIPCEVLYRALLHNLPASIQARSVEEVTLKFNARYWAISRTYRYYLLNTRLKLPFGRDFYFNYPGKLNLRAIKESFKYLLGEHDFSSFRKGQIDEKNPVRNIWRLELFQEPVCFPGLPPENKFLVFEIEAASFLPGMVRMLIGTFLRVGRGELTPHQVKEILEARNCELGGPAVSPYGLYLTEVKYPPLPC